MKVRNVALVIGCFLVSTLMQAKDKGTLITCFSVHPVELEDQVNTFVNNTGGTMSVRYILQDCDSGCFYKQEPILQDGQSLEVSFSKAAAYAKTWKNPLRNYEFSIEILRVLRSPKRLTENVTQGLKKGRMRNVQSADLIEKSEFFKNRRIEFCKDKKGRVFSKLSYGSAQ